MATAGEIWTGMSGQSRGDDSGAGKFLGSAPDIKNPYEDLTAQVLAQQGRDRLAKQKEAQAAKETVAKYADDLKINNFRDQYAGAAAKEILGQANELGRMQAEGASPIAILEKKKAYEQENAVKSEKAKRAYDAIDKWKQDGAKLQDESTLGKYDRERYARKMDHLGELLDTGDFDAVEKFVTDPNNTPLVAKVDPDEIIKKYINPKYKNNRDGSKEFDRASAAENFGIFLNMEDSPEIIDALVKTGFGKDEAEVEANLMKKAENMTPYDPAPIRSSSDGSSGAKSGIEAIATYDPNVPKAAGTTGDNVVVFKPKGQNFPDFTFVDENGEGFTSNNFTAKVNENGNGWIVEAEVTVPQPIPPDTSMLDDKIEEIKAMSIPEDRKDALKAPIVAERAKLNREYENKLKSFTASNKIKKKFQLSNKQGEAGFTNYQMISSQLDKPLESYIKQAGGGTQIKRSDIKAKATASGYTVAEYEKLLKEKGVKIID